MKTRDALHEGCINASAVARPLGGTSTVFDMREPTPLRSRLTANFVESFMPASKWPEVQHSCLICADGSTLLQRPRQTA